MSKYKVTIVLQGELIQNLHFGPYAKYWWISRPTHNDLTYTFLYLIRLGMKTITTVNQRDFIITVVQNNFEPSSSEAITSIYQQAFSTKTRLDGLLVMGYDDSEIYKMLLSDIYFHPYTFKIGNLNVIIFEIGKLNNPDWNYAGKGYQSSFVYNFRKTRTIFFQEFNNNNAIVRIYQNFQEIRIFHDTNPNSVWSKIGILVQFTGSMLFGLEHERTNRRVCLGFDISQGSDIELAIEGIRRISVAHLKPERTKDKTSEWPCDGDYAGYIRARAIPNIGEWNNFLPAKLEKLKKKEIQKPHLQVTQHSTPKSPWFIPLLHKSVVISHHSTADYLQELSEEK
ncbi:11601_t:CDS:2, partial [Dentiscutata erythropus]